jgi:hypothetical protein
MAKRRLNEKDVDQLLAHYRAERRRLNFQLDQVREAMAKLQGNRKANAGEEVEDGEAPKRRGRKPADPAKPRYRRKPGRRKKRTVKEGGYRLNEWDNQVVAAITKNNRLLTKQELLDALTTWAKKAEPKMKAADIEVKLTRTLQKLSGKRGVLGTHRTGLVRGYHYGLKEWFFASSGKLRSSNLDKLVLTDK